MTISEAQALLRPLPVTARSRRDLRVLARWWELEAQRGYPSSDKSREYAANMRWLIELLDNGVAVFGRDFDEVVKERKAARRRRSTSSALPVAS